jgi:hypothetical protein
METLCPCYCDRGQTGTAARLYVMYRVRANRIPYSATNGSRLAFSAVTSRKPTTLFSFVKPATPTLITPSNHASCSSRQNWGSLSRSRNENKHRRSMFAKGDPNGMRQVPNSEQYKSYQMQQGLIQPDALGGHTGLFFSTISNCSLIRSRCSVPGTRKTAP